MSKKLKIAFFTPIKEGSKSYYFSLKVLPYLKENFDIDVFSNNEKNQEFLGLKTYHYLYAFKKDSEKNYDIFFYQIENSKDTNFIRSYIALKKGIVLFHDFEFDVFPPQSILQTTLPQNAYRARREFGHALFSLACNMYDVSLGANYTRENIKTKYKNNILYISYPSDEQLKTKDFLNKNDRLKIFFKGDIKISSRFHKVLKALAGRDDVELVWCTKKENEEKANLLCAQSGVKYFSNLRNSLIQEEKKLSESDIFINLPNSKNKKHDIYLINKALIQGIFVISGEGKDIEVFPKNSLLKVKKGRQESFMIKFFIDKIKENKELIDFNALRENYFLKFSGKEIAKELTLLFESLKDKIKEYQEKENEEYKNAKEKVIQKAFEEEEEFLKEERQELGYI